MKISRTALSSIAFVVYFFLAFAVNPASVPSRGFVMTGLALLIYIIIGDRYIWRDHFSSISSSLALIFICYGISGLINNTEVFGHLAYGLQYLILIACINKYSFIKNDILPIVKMAFWPAFIGGPVIGLYQLVTGTFLSSAGATSQDYLFITTIISDVKHSNANYAAITMLFCLFLSALIYEREKKDIYLIASGISMICVVLTYSRTAIFLMAMSLIIIFAIHTHQAKDKGRGISRKNIVYIFVVLVIVVVVAVRGFTLLQNYTAGANLDTLERFKSNSSLSMRTDQWKAAIEIIFDNGPLHFLFGFSDNAATQMGLITGRTMSAHNFIFGRASEEGFLGMIAAICIYVKCIISVPKAIKTNPSSKSIIIGTTCILLAYLMISIISWELIIALELFDVIINMNKEYIEELRDE